MKTLILSLIAVMCVGFSNVTSADVVTTDYSTWQTVPITVNSTTGTYTVTGPVPTGNYYYTYSGYQCFTVQRSDLTVNPVTYNLEAGGSTIYCYPTP